MKLFNCLFIVILLATSCSTTDSLMVLKNQSGPLVVSKLVMHNTTADTCYEVKDWTVSRDSISGDFQGFGCQKHKQSFYQYRNTGTNRSEIHLYPSSSWMKTQEDSVSSILMRNLKGVHILIPERDYILQRSQIYSLLNREFWVFSPTSEYAWRIMQPKISLEGISGTPVKLLPSHRTSSKYFSAFLREGELKPNEMPVPLEQFNNIGTKVYDYRKTFLGVAGVSAAGILLLIIAMDENESSL
ncbi:hypothetical protein [Luteibaculum oceani]|uniref:RING-type E3 ubiquitin transferase n=1 Tax=Luteibaculum oceani TaxID=1294296 RepID=A0A5C6USF6_9FLAO|nr:hypothetical protein [Luteibaculum oceani]TXC75600.1 hypothetical protein FRX97_11840 [Luteibaculum oceani]